MSWLRLALAVLWDCLRHPLGTTVVRIPVPDTISDLSDALSGCSRDDLSSVALELLWPLPRAWSGSLGGTIERCDAAERWVRQARAKYANYQPARLRSEIMSWTKFIENEARESRRDIETQKSVNKMRVYSKQQDEKRERVQTIMRRIRNVSGTP